MDFLITIFLCGDVMLGRGIDQVMAESVDPGLHEPYAQDARDYVRLAERAGAEIPEPVEPAYVWGDALTVLNDVQPDARVINLETAVTARGDPQPDKGIHYRMHPENVSILKSSNIDAASLANNHVLDWGEAGLRDTLKTLRSAEIAVAGAGLNDDQAEAPAIIDVEGQGRVLVFSFARPTSGVPADWAATARRPGVVYLPNLSNQSVERIAALVKDAAGEDDLVVFSIHWGGNWGYDIPEAQQRFARRLIDEAGVDVVHGHSSHHVKGIEVYKDQPIFYGCGDFLNDYEGIAGHERYRPDLTLMYLPTFDRRTGKLTELRLKPMRIRNFQLSQANEADTRWLRQTLNRQSEAFGVEFAIDPEAGDLTASWE